MLPGGKRHLPVAARELVEKALIDHDLAEAPADDARWVELYDELQRLIEHGGSIESTSSDNATATPSADNEEDDYQWAPSSDDDEEASSSTAPPLQSQHDPHTQAHLTSLVPNPSLSQAVHAYISEALTNGRGRLPKDVPTENWDPASLAVMSMLVEEVAKSQAKFNAQRTMFAKSPRNQALAAKREAQKKLGEEKESDD
ncbi:uncharacterized protein SPSC_05021 [Sporisorium scitamineum]|uniref:Uncharacterized protein n=1 Tax=Sporisorium scitamineum TaxID=49012 RepID=A0A127ZHR5_9BASI|nr:uncharacterized protein SPSC_05021 [Sporisorium scitamineum]